MLVRSCLVLLLCETAASLLVTPDTACRPLTGAPAAIMQRARVSSITMEELPQDVTTSKRPLWMPPEKSEEEKARDASLKADFEFDATTVTALLGLAIAFQFFVVANL
jgi:hypothetical protein